MRRNINIAKFWSKVDKSGDCWVWTGHLLRGYGTYNPPPKRCSPIGAHRISWELANGPIPARMIVRHKCDNPPCVNPAHLELGTHQDNVADRVARDRTAKGATHYMAKLTEDDIIDIRTVFAMGGMQKDIAQAYGITQPNVSMIVNRHSWSWL